jgi:hypothetical protein
MIGFPAASVPSAIRLTFEPSNLNVMVMLFIAQPGPNLDLATFSFQVPMKALSGREEWRKCKANCRA